MLNAFVHTKCYIIHYYYRSTLIWLFSPIQENNLFVSVVLLWKSNWNTISLLPSSLSQHLEQQGEIKQAAAWDGRAGSTVSHKTGPRHSAKMITVCESIKKDDESIMVRTKENINKQTSHRPGKGVSVTLNITVSQIIQQLLSFCNHKTAHLWEREI